MTKRLLILDTSSNCLDMALRAKMAGWQVRWYDAPRKDGGSRRAGEGMIDKIKDFSEIQRKWLDWADLVYLPDNTRWLDMLEPYRLAGYPILAPGVDAAALELDRDAGQKALAKAGVKIMDSKEFRDYDAAIAFVKKHPTYLVSKPSGDAAKALSYVASDPADLTYMLTRWKSNDSLRAAAKAEGFILQERKYGVEMAVGGWYGPGGWSQWFYENWEYKKLMTGDLGVNTGEMGCYDDQTEVLTSTGWVKWPDVTEGMLLATLIDGKTVFEKPSVVVQYDYTGPMVCWENQTLDICVTPNHNMYVNGQFHARAKDDSTYGFKLAEECTEAQYEVMRTADWAGVSPEKYVIPERKGYNRAQPQREFNIVPFARFMGLATAEGWFGEKRIVIAQSHPEKLAKVERVIADAGIKFNRVTAGLDISDVQMAQHFKGYGRAWEKRVPEFVKSGSKEVISAFLDGYALGDGNMQPNGFRVFYTTSEGLAGDVQELLLKIGRVGIVKPRDRIGKSNLAPCGTRQITARRISYEVIERVKKTRSWLDARDRSERMYSGKVYCATVSSHILYVRRNGKPLWCGNTLSRMTRSSKLADQVLKPVAATLDKLGYVGFIDVACIIDKDGPWPMEFTMRDGWPTKHNVTAHVKNEDPVQWMLDGLQGRDTIEAVEGEVCVSVVIALPDFPYSRITNKELCGIPVRGADDMDHIHLSEVMLGTAPCMVGDRVVDMPGLVTAGDYSMVVTGTGMSITAARRSAYAAVDKVKIPNSPFWRTDIGIGRMKRQLPDLHKMGYARGLNY